MLYIGWMVIVGDHGIKKRSFENFNFRAAQGEKLLKQVVHWPIQSCEPLLVENSHFTSLARVVTGSQQG